MKLNLDAFNNTEIAFKGKSDKDLRKARLLFNMVKSIAMVKLGKALLSFALFIRFPINWIIKPTIFSHFCGGETINECEPTIESLGKYNIGTILDFSSEGNNSEEFFNLVAQEVIATIEKATNNKHIPFSVFKMTGIARFGLLEKLNEHIELNEDEAEEFGRIKERLNSICWAAYKNDVRIFIDAEESWIQDAIDELTDAMMQQFNKEKAIVYNTLQLYRHDRVSFLENHIAKAKKDKYFVGYKLVRGAYMEKENHRAAEKAYQTPINPSKEKTDNCYNNALRICIENCNIVSICAGTHNESSSALLTKLMFDNNLQPNDKRIYFSQLLGMSDHISYNLVHKGYNVAKYVPYGPVKAVMPYLIRRAEENTSIAGQTGRELSLIKKELVRRKK